MRRFASAKRLSEEHLIFEWIQESNKKTITLSVTVF